MKNVNLQPTIVYTPVYDIHFWGIEKMHPFDSRKYSRAYRMLRHTFGQPLETRTTAPKAQISQTELLTVHSESYLQRLHSSAYLSRIVEIPVLAKVPYPVLNYRLLRPMRWGVAGTCLAASIALERGIAVNLSGGYHHASREQGEGFTIYSDIALAIVALRLANRLNENQKAMIVDLDAHQGNGHERIFYEDRSVYIFDMYNQHIYPRDAYARQRINYDVPLMPGCGGDEYLSLLRKALPAAIKAAGEVGVAIYVAGTDVFERDFLGMLSLDEEAVCERDRYVIDTFVKAEIPLVMVLGGGYSPDSYRLIAAAVDYIMRRYAGLR